MNHNLLIILFLVGLGVYINTLPNNFIWDDEDLIVEDKYIKDVRYAGYLFSPEYWRENFVAREGRYRPLRALTFVAEWQLWKKNPLGYHLTNLLLNLLAVFGVYYLAKILFADGLKAFFSGLLFAVHPAHVESVAWIKNRTDILMTIFYTFGAGMFIKYFKSNKLDTKNMFIVGAMFVLSLISKEVAVTMPLVLLAYLVLIEKENFVVSVKKVLPFLIISVVFLAFVVGFLRASQIKSPIDIKGNILALTQYLRLLILPYDLNAERALVTGVDLLGPIFFAVVIYLVIKRKLYEELFAILWVLIALLPALDIRFITSRPIAEQRLYLPSAGICLLAGSQMSKKLWSRILLIAIIFGFSGITFARNFDWRDSVAFWSKTVKQSPDSARAWHNLGIGYERKGDIQQAVLMYEKSIALDPTISQPYISIGNIALNTGNLTISEQMFNKALQISPDSVDALKGLAKVYMEQGKFSRAEKIYQQILNNNPNNAEIANALGVVWLRSGRKDKAIEMFGKASNIAPEYGAPLYNLARIYHQDGRISEAIEFYKKLLAIDRENIDAMNNLGIAYLMQKEPDKAKEIFKKAVEINPNYYPAHYNLGNIYFDEKKYIESLAEFTRVKEINPAHQMAKLKIERLKKLVSKNE